MWREKVQSLQVCVSVDLLMYALYNENAFLCVNFLTVVRFITGLASVY